MRLCTLAERVVSSAQRICQSIIKVSEGLRRFQEVSSFNREQCVVSSCSGWKPVLLVTVGKCFSICLRIMVMLFTAGWKPVPH